jgi:uncharacterized ferritin-like protein (DUF455 family)
MEASMTTTAFVDELTQFVNERLASLDLLKDPELQASDRGEIVRRLKIALKNEIEASELAAVWMASTPEIDVKLALARQAGDEAKHYRLIEKHLAGRGVDTSAFNPVADGYGPMFQLLTTFQTTVERLAAANLTRESLALKKNEQFIEFCEKAGDPETAAFYRAQIQPDEEWHVDLGRRMLGKYAVGPELQDKARAAAQAVLDLAVKIQNKQLKELKLSHAPGC